MPQTAIAIGARVHRVQFQQPTRIKDGDGGYKNTWTDLTPASAFVQIIPATAQALEHLAASATIQTTVTHIVTGPYHPQVTTLCRLLFHGRVFHILGVTSREERNVEMVLLCVEHQVSDPPAEDRSFGRRRPLRSA